MARQSSTDTGQIPYFGVLDYVMFVLTLLISCVIGVYYAYTDRKNNTTKEFLLGGQNMNPLPVGFSLMVTFMSAMTLLGNPAEVYNFNTMWWWLVISMILAMWSTSVTFVPFFYKLKVESVFQYLHMRFSKHVGITACILLVFQTLIYMAFLLYAPSLALNAVTGVHLWGSVIGMGCVVTFYTTIGGMKAVLWTDTFQAFVIIAGLLAVLIQGSIIEGGFDKAWQVAEAKGRIVFDDFSLDPKKRHSVWSIVFGGWAFWLYLYGINQAQVQRCLSCQSVRKAQMAIWINLPGLAFIVSTCCMIGIVMFAFYVDCHPITYGLIAKTDQLVPLYVMDILGSYPGLPGLFVSCVISGSLSSLSSGLNALSAVTFRDIVQQLCQSNVSEFRSTLTTKLLVVFYGVLAIALAYVVSNLGSVLEAAYVTFGVINGPLLGVFTLGMFFPWANKHGAAAGMTVSLALLLWIGIGAFVHGIKSMPSPTYTTKCNFTAKPSSNVSALSTRVLDNSSPLIELYKLSYMYYTAAGMLVVWFVGLLVSFVTGHTHPKNLDPRLICPVFEELIPCLPDKIKIPLRCGIIHEAKYDKNACYDFELDIKKASAASLTDLEDVLQENKATNVNNETKTFSQSVTDNYCYDKENQDHVCSKYSKTTLLDTPRDPQN